MDMHVAPTKANLIRAKSFLEFSEKGFDLLDKKRNVLIREMMGLTEKAKEIQHKMEVVFSEAYKALQIASISIGMHRINEIGLSIPIEENYQVLLRSVMGVEIPTVKYEKKDLIAHYGFYRTNPAIDIAVKKFHEIKYLIYDLAEMENSIYKLAMEIKKTQKRANALEKIQIPKYTAQIKIMEEVLEEKEREDFFRLKRVKQRK